jgi:glutathione S-transferase
MATAPEPRLISLAISPFNDFARWSLERSRVAYREEPKALVLHVMASRRAGGLGTTPVLVVDGKAIPESAQIAGWAARHQPADVPPLYPQGEAGEEVRTLVKRFVDDLGPATRRIIWQHLIQDPKLASRYWGQGLSPGQARVQPWALRFSKIPVRRALGLQRDKIEAAPGEIRAIFDEVAERLTERSRIVGEEITAADLCFAAMASPALAPPEGYPVPMPQPDEFPDDVAATMRELRSHPAGEYALRLYRESRAAQPAV